MNAEILSIGSELMAGRIADTNAAYLSDRLMRLGMSVVRHTAIDDELDAISKALIEIAARSDVAIVTGGIGPTPDDVTRQAFASCAGVALVQDAGAAKALRERYAAYGREPSPSNLIQASVPEGAKVIPNPRGTAAGFMLRLKQCEFYCLPGVPSEMKAMFEGGVAPSLAGRSGRAAHVTCLQVFGLPESIIGERLNDMMQRGRDPQVATQARDGVITVRVTASGADQASVAERCAAAAAEIRRRLGAAVYAEGDRSLADVVAGLLAKRSETLAVAESCTGGEISARLTDVPGISRHLLESVVTYSNESKVERLGVPGDMIEAHGAVSAEVAAEMAAGMRRTSGARIALAVTGIAGPTGGTAAKPVGLVYIALSAADANRVEERRLLGDRMTVRDRAAKYALNMLRLYLEGRLSDG